MSCFVALITTYSVGQRNMKFVSNSIFGIWNFRGSVIYCVTSFHKFISVYIKSIECCHHKPIRFNDHTHDKNALHEFPPSVKRFPTFFFSRHFQKRNGEKIKMNNLVNAKTCHKKKINHRNVNEMAVLTDEWFEMVVHLNRCHA